MVIFLAILTLGLAYVWVKGDLDWVKKLVERAARTAADADAVDEEVTAP